MVLRCSGREDFATTAAPGPTPTAARRLVLYGDFNCPWSYLASRRAALLALEGVEIDWRAVEHDAPRGSEPRGSGEASAVHARLGHLLAEMQEVLGVLLPSEELPYALAGFVPHTGAAATGYAEAYRAGVAAPVRQLLFEALWLHGFDLGDASVVHTVIVDAVRSGSAAIAPQRDWEYGPGANGHPAEAAQLLGRWATAWCESGNRSVPTLDVDGDRVHRLRGVEAVTWLGAELASRRLVPGPGAEPDRHLQRRTSASPRPAAR